MNHARILAKTNKSNMLYIVGKHPWRITRMNKWSLSINRISYESNHVYDPLIVIY